MGLHWRLRHPEALRHLSGVETAEALFTDLCIKQTNLTFLSYLTKQPFLFISLGEGPLLCIKLQCRDHSRKEGRNDGKEALFDAFHGPLALLSFKSLKQNRQESSVMGFLLTQMTALIPVPTNTEQLPSIPHARCCSSFHTHTLI